MRSAGAIPGEQTTLLSKDVYMQVLGSWCFETTNTCNSDHMGTTGQGQLYPCHLWNVGNASPRKDSNPHTLRFPTHPLKHTRSVILSQDVCTRPCFLDTDDTSPCQTYIMNYSRTRVLMSVLEENNISLRFPSPLDVAWGLIKETEKWLRNSMTEDQGCRIGAQAPVWEEEEKEGAGSPLISLDLLSD